jgi:hypothetical protein
MSQGPVSAGPLSRPTGLDYFLILFGAALSLFLQQISRLEVFPRTKAPEWVVLYVVPVLPSLLILPQGILLLWPLFYCTQRLVGRPQALAPGEWLWGFGWLGTVFLAAYTCWARWGTLPSFLTDLKYPPPLVWNVYVVPALALIALGVGFVGLFARRQSTWTNTFGVVLLIWPVIPLGGLWLWAKDWTWE